MDLYGEDKSIHRVLFSPLRCLWIQSGVGWTWVLRLREGFPGGSNGKESACNAGDMDSIPGSGREDPLEKGMATHTSGILARRIP